MTKQPKQDKDRIEFEEFCGENIDRIIITPKKITLNDFLIDIYNWHIQKQLELLEEIKKEVGENRKGTFTDDGGNDCWYIEDLEKHIDSKILSIKEELK